MKVKDDIKTLLNAKLPYREVHKSSNGGFNSNVAIVHPIISSNTSSVNPPFNNINGINSEKTSHNVLKHQDALGLYFSGNFYKILVLYFFHKFITCVFLLLENF